jgi:hypothetical protein
MTGFFLFATASRPLSSAYEGLLPPGVKRRGVKLTTNLHLVQSLRMRGAILPLPQYVFMAWCSVKHRDNCSFTLPILIQHAHNKTWACLYMLKSSWWSCVSSLLYVKATRSLTMTVRTFQDSLWPQVQDLCSLLYIAVLCVNIWLFSFYLSAIVFIWIQNKTSISCSGLLLSLWILNGLWTNSDINQLILFYFTDGMWWSDVLACSSM